MEQNISQLTMRFSIATLLSLLVAQVMAGPVPDGEFETDGRSGYNSVANGRSGYNSIDD